MGNKPNYITTGTEGAVRIYEVYRIGASWNCFEVDSTNGERNVLGRTLSAFSEHKLRENIARYERELDGDAEPIVQVVTHAEAPDTKVVAYRVVKVDGKPPAMEAVTVAYRDWIKLVLDGWYGTQKAAFEAYQDSKVEGL